MEFLFKSRSEGKRQIKPSPDIQYLEDEMGNESSEDSDFEIGAEKSEDDNSDESSESPDSTCEEPNDEPTELSEDIKSEPFPSIETSKPISDEILLQQKICGVCLGDKSNDANEIVECDGCGVSVHEICYGIFSEDGEDGGGSISSVLSEASTEPWFCDPCKANLKDSPPCELCPSIGGVYKETDVKGRWVHLVCALYINGVAFGDLDKLSNVTIFEMNYGNWGKRSCSLCSEVRFLRTGICIQCDAGLCKAYFHVTCAQSNGLLVEPSFSETDPYIAHCKLHSDSFVVSRRKRSFATMIHQGKRRRDKIQNSPFDLTENDLHFETPRQRILRKLKTQQSSFKVKQEAKVVPFIRKMPRSLSTSASAIRKIQRLRQLTTGLDINRQTFQESHLFSLRELHKKWHISPAFNVEFVAYFQERHCRLKEVKGALSRQVSLFKSLSESQESIRSQFELIHSKHSITSQKHVKLKHLVYLYQSTLEVAGNISLSFLLSSSSYPSSSPKVEVLKSCGICSSSEQQHLLIHCDTCDIFYHLACLTPPLSRMPKRSKLYTWQCSECDRLSSEKETSFDTPRRIRQIHSHTKPSSSSPPPSSLKDFDSGEILEDNRNSSKSQNDNCESKPIKIKIKALLEASNVAPSFLSPTLIKRRKRKRKKGGCRGDEELCCSKCFESGTRKNSVQCDECRKVYHFSCLLPPLRKSPKVTGYGWHCIDCDPSDQDWHLD